jgi:CheY-like chemotaxis protein/anti-sigma regulatory factor (Ser/Thr protein kinase)
MARLLARVHGTFAEAAREKGLSLKIVPSSNWVRSDFILLERILGNLVSNAVRYTSTGGLLVGCRVRGDMLRIEVWDTGAGIPADERDKIFGEFYRLGEPDRDHRAGIGLGLAIVDRLARLLGCQIELTSTVGKGSRFVVIVPSVPARAEVAEPPAAVVIPFDVAKGKLVVVVDDDLLVLDGMGGLLRSWGCRVVTASSVVDAIDGLAAHPHAPDVIITDYRLTNGTTGFDVIERMCGKFGGPIPAFLISGDTNPEPLHEARAGGYNLLHKPVEPMALRAMLNRMLRQPAKVA